MRLRPKSRTTTTPKSNLPQNPDAFVTAFIELIQGHHLSAALEMVADDCEYDHVPINKLLEGFWPNAVHMSG